MSRASIKVSMSSRVKAFILDSTVLAYTLRLRVGYTISIIAPGLQQVTISALFFHPMNLSKLVILVLIIIDSLRYPIASLRRL